MYRSEKDDIYRHLENKGPKEAKPSEPKPNFLLRLLDTPPPRHPTNTLTYLPTLHHTHSPDPPTYTHLHLLIYLSTLTYDITYLYKSITYPSALHKHTHTHNYNHNTYPPTPTSLRHLTLHPASYFSVESTVMDEYQCCSVSSLVICLPLPTLRHLAASCLT